MSSNTKIVVLKSKELIYTGIFVLLGALLILLLFYMFSDKKKDQPPAETTDTATETTCYLPGIYTSDVNLGGSKLHMVVTVDNDKVSHVDIENLDDTVTVMYPLLLPCLDEINSKLPLVNNIDDITFASDNQYTTLLLLDAVKNTVAPAMYEPE